MHRTERRVKADMRYEEETGKAYPGPILVSLNVVLQTSYALLSSKTKVRNINHALFSSKASHMFFFLFER